MAGCCRAGEAPRPLARRLSGVAASAAPGLVLALLPKCPLCLAAWVAMTTGISLSSTAAAGVRGGIVAACFATVALVAMRGFRRWRSSERAVAGHHVNARNGSTREWEASKRYE